MTFEKYGGPENIVPIINEINETVEFVIDGIIISQRFIMKKNDYKTIVQYDDIVDIKIGFRRRRGRCIWITDKDNNIYCFSFFEKNYKYMPNVVAYLMKKCKK